MKTNVFCLCSNKEGLITISMEISQLCDGVDQTSNGYGTEGGHNIS